MKLGSLFSGCGGMDLGLEKSGMRCVWQVENMQFGLKILTRHWPKVPKHTDISTWVVIGNAVTVNVAQWIGERIMKYENERTDS